MSSLPDKLPIVPFTRPVHGSVTLPGSKSITNRALILAALAKGTTTLHGALFSRDTRIMVAALTALGFDVKTDETAKTITIVGLDGKIPVREAKIDIGNAGTAARFLTAFVCLQPNGIYHFDGDEAMRRRPIGALLGALESQGAKASAHTFPFTLRTAALKGGELQIDATESSQMLSALLMVAPFAQAETVIKSTGNVRMPFVEMTDKLMVQFTGIGSSLRDGTFRSVRLTETLRYASRGVYNIEPDASAASYFLTLPLVSGGTLTLPGLKPPGHGLQGDTRFMDVLKEAGATITPQFITPPSPDFLPLYPQCTGIEVSRSPLLKCIEQDFSEFSDTFLTLAAIAPLLDGSTKISGIAHTRKQETDRVAGMARELTKLGQHVIETEDSLEIHPRPLTSGVEIETYHDHRFAMSFGILGCHDLHGNGQPWLTIKDPSCCSKTFPHFFDELERLRAESQH